jgi:hypothetical protein
VGYEMIVWSTADFYGASSLVGARSRFFPSMPSASWTHGCIFGVNPEWPIFLSKHESYFSKHLVTNSQQRDALEFLNKDVVAVGLPFAYAHRRFYSNNIVRTINRLYVPAHSIAMQDLHSGFKELMVAALKMQCDHILLNSNDYNKLMGKKGFNFDLSVTNIKIIRGANVKDRCCLERMVNIFQATKVIVTDAIGSHLFYATLCGCEVSIVDLKRPTFQSYQNTLSKMINPWHDAFVRYFKMVSEGNEILDQVSVFTKESTLESRVELSRSMVGMDFVLSNDELLKHLTNFNLSKKISNSTYLFLRKLRFINDY